MIADTNANYKMWSDLRKYILGEGMTRANFRKNYVGRSYRSRLDTLLKHSQAGEYIEELAKQAPTAPRNEKGVVISYLESLVAKLKKEK